MTIHNRAKGKYRPEGHALRIRVENLNSLLGDDVKSFNVAYGRSVTVKLASKTVKFEIASMSTRRQKTPDHVALRFGDGESMTYRE
ncbi:MAG: hypothetical protein J0I21_18900, partial [Alphaproteobacteria bacterium]|nr:hypothetical protein [Alphaproteobacteria bacterium]